MRKELHFLLIIFLIISTLSVSRSFGQRVEWASEIIEFSSEFGIRQYSVNQALGKPNVLPNLGASPNAWSPKRKGRKEFIKVGFEQHFKIQQIAVAETYNPGGISAIYAYDKNNKEYLLNTFTPRSIPIEGRLLRFFFDETAYEVYAIKIEFDASPLHGLIGVDAIGISDSKDPITVEINLTEEVTNDFLPVALGPNINSGFNELRPLITSDASTLFFSRQNHPGNVGGINDDDDIWFTKRDSINGEWKDPVNIGRPLNNDGPNFISSISSDGSAMLLLLGNAYYTKNKMTQGVSMSVKQPDGSWSKPKNLDIVDDYNKSEKANYFLSDDMETIIMSVERKDTHGDRDLYVTFLQDNGKWSQPKNLGNVVNSADEEGAPFLAADGKTLFFSSKGFSGFGGYDIYLTRRLDDTWENWSEPENLGASFNSGEDDIFFNFTENDEYAYFSRGTQENTDIYKVKLPYYQKPDIGPPVDIKPTILVSIKGRVFDSNTLKPLDASIEFIKVVEQPSIELVDADTSGFRTTLSEGFKYQIIAKSAGHYNTADSLDLSFITQSTEIEKNLYLDPIIQNQAIVLNNVYFDFDSDVIRPESFPELDRISEMMLDNPVLTMKIDGHTCSMGSDAYNLNLSSKRARSIVMYLIKTGVDGDRLESEGFGESRPIAPNDTEEGREINRRVEFKISKEGNVSSSNEL